MKANQNIQNGPISQDLETQLEMKATTSNEKMIKKLETGFFAVIRSENQFMQKLFNEKSA